ncbi:hypothetical protein CONPUDRAFT_118030 [Coniophora puteana RWD-64-598 SS2]|uniref:G-patch domain-containing protein n=1 Tax=Coniophora puteana (strain RWD-64-598) TaxID=741705 RepID=A0A5M3N2N3_CONPW|nr:uncharacterized protein CONPUDRAFT_118030 [Coniophora puteana RWD-64-598 SS2]EIW85284.1 hypothetical protein CONPUDRAFT_118030 [Coniophora puteana RWD-64-598 SS2]
MAYNREWDKGKDDWGGDSSSWSGGGGGDRFYSRGREDDYYGEGKRRKYNNGGYDAGYSYGDGSYDPNWGQGQANQGDHSQDYGHDERPGKPFGGKKRLVPSEPSPHVIFLGLDPDFSEADLQAYLVNNACNIETVTIIRERSTGTCPFTFSSCARIDGFGFAQFASVEHARAFVDPLFPFIQIPPPASHGASATAAFYKALETGTPHNGRRVKIDYSQSALPHDKSRTRQNMNDGTRDIGNSPAPVLLFRGLDPLSGPQAIAQAMISSAGPGNQGSKGMKRIVLIKDKVTLASFGFAFVEFIDAQSASGVLANTMSATIHPQGFRISDKPVAASFAHPYSFQPVTDYMLRDDTSITSSMSLGGVENTFVKYWDETATVAVLEFKVDEPVSKDSQQATSTKEKKEKKKKDDSSNKLPQASVLPVSDKPVTLSFGKGLSVTSKPAGPTGPTKAPALGFSAEDFEGSDADKSEEYASGKDDAKSTAAKRVGPMIASKKTVNNIQKWNQVKEELKEDIGARPAPATVPTTAPTTAPTAAPAAPLVTKSPLPQEDLEFADIGALMCLLCSRQFKTTEQLKRHDKESDLHKKNLRDSNLREVAHQKLAQRRTESSSKGDAEGPRYRDRAQERRVMHHQPDVPLPEPSVASASKRKRHAEGPPPPPSPPPPPTNPGEDESNVGNKLLKMMGWTEGSGLGTEGDGRVDPIQTAMYAQGVGLGASKGKDVGKYADGYAGYVHMAQDAARERYGN